MTDTDDATFNQSITYPDGTSITTSPSGGAQGVRFASEFSGADGGEQIQNAIDDIVNNEPHGGVVVVGPTGPDTFSPSTTYNQIDETWNIGSQPITFGDDIIVYLTGGATIAVSEEDTKKFPFQPKDTSNGQTGFALVGENPETCLIHGNAANQTSAAGTTAGGIRVDECNRVLIQGVALGPVNGHAIRKENTTKLVVDNVRFNQDGNASNQDGITGGNSDYNLISNCYGEVADDGFGVGNGAQYVAVVNCHLEEAQNGGYDFVNVNVDSNNVTEHIYVQNCTYTAGGGAHFIDLENDTGNADDRRYISVDNCGLQIADDGAGGTPNDFLSINGSAAGVWVTNVQARGPRGILTMDQGTVRGLRISGVGFFQENNHGAGVWTISGGTIRNGRFTNWQSRYDGAQDGSSERYFTIGSFNGSTTLERCVFENIYGEQHATYFDVHDNGGNGITLTDVTLDTFKGTANPGTDRGAVFESSGVTYNNVRLTEVSLPTYTFGVNTLYWNDVLGGGPIGGVDLTAVTGDVEGEQARSDGTATSFPVGTLATWDSSVPEWVRADGQATV